MPAVLGDGLDCLTPDLTTRERANPLFAASLVELLEFCDRYLARKASGKADPVPSPKERPAVDTARLEQLLGQLRGAPARPELIAPLRERIVEGSDDQLVRVRPFALADSWRADRLEVLRLLLYATRCGLFELRWELMCPNCRVPKQEVDSLARLPVRFHCEICGISYGAELDQSVELRFSIHPAVRAASDQVYCPSHAAHRTTRCRLGYELARFIKPYDAPQTSRSRR